VPPVEPKDDELRGIAVSVNVLIEKLDKEVKFAEEIGKGDFYTNFGTGQEDVMGHTLIKMRDNLLTLTQENVSALHESQAQEEELRQQNETMQQIQANLEQKTQEAVLFNRELADRSEKLNDMIAEMEINKEEMMTIQETLEKKNKEMEEAQIIDSHLSALDDMMRLNYDKSVQEFSEIIMFHLCKITNSLRGAMFILDGERLKAVGGYCCTPTTMEKNEFELGENLLAQAAKTKEFIFLNNIPGAAKIKSSLTFIETTNILIAPLVYNEKVQGVLEISGLEAYQSRHTEFAKKACKNIAAMLQNIFSNSQTRKLLIESQEMSNKLQVQEEETRQMLEESRATQEEMERRNLELNALMNAIQATESYFEIDRDGKIIYANDILLKNLHFNHNELADKNYELIVDKLAPRDKNANVSLESLLRGYTASGFQLFVAKDGSKKEFWTYFSPVTNREGLVLKIIVAATLA
jgi:PAS domain-containing protein